MAITKSIQMESKATAEHWELVSINFQDGRACVSMRGWVNALAKSEQASALKTESFFLPTELFSPAFHDEIKTTVETYLINNKPMFMGGSIS